MRFLYSFSIALSGYIEQNYGPSGINEVWVGWTATDYGNYGNMYAVHASENDAGIGDYKMYNDLAVRCIVDH